VHRARSDFLGHIHGSDRLLRGRLRDGFFVTLHHLEPTRFGEWTIRRADGTMISSRVSLSDNIISGTSAASALSAQAVGSLQANSRDADRNRRRGEPFVALHTAVRRSYFGLRFDAQLKPRPCGTCPGRDRHADRCKTGLFAAIPRKRNPRAINISEARASPRFVAGEANMLAIIIAFMLVASPAPA
jgi:hypothetical protein